MGKRQQTKSASDDAPPPAKAPKSCSGAGALVVDMAQVTGMNAEHLERMDAARDDVLLCPSFKNIKTAAPLAIGRGGTKVPFNIEDYKAAISSEGVYECGGNWWWVQHNYAPVRNVYINTKMVEKDIEETFPNPVAHLEHEVLVGVSRDTRTAKVPIANTLERLSASEFDDAFLLAVHASVKNNDKDAIKIWNTAFLTVKFRFVALDNEDEKMYQSIKERNRVGHRAEVASRTMLQRPAACNVQPRPPRWQRNGRALERQDRRGRWAQWRTYLRELCQDCRGHLQDHDRRRRGAASPNRL